MQNTSTASETHDWGDQPNPGQDAARRAHIQAVFKVAVKTLTRCPDCSAYLTEAVTHTGARIRVETTAYERFVVEDGEIWVASGYVLRDHSHRCNPSAIVMAQLQAEAEATKNLETEAAWSRHRRRRDRVRAHDRAVSIDVPDPIGGARETGS